jgi:pilus assembly protein Flp/PilA
MRERRPISRISAGPGVGMTSQIRRLWHDEDGATMVEYGFILLLIATVCVGAVALLGQGVLGLFASVPAPL